MHSNHWTQDAMKRAERLVGEAAETLEGKPLGIAADYLESVACDMQANGDPIRHRVARRMYLNAQAREERHRVRR